GCAFARPKPDFVVRPLQATPQSRYSAPIAVGGVDMGRGPAKRGSPNKRKSSRKGASRRGGPPKRGAVLAARGVGRAARRRPPAKAGPKSESAQFAIELNGALQRQAATSEILRVISQSPSDAQPVFEAIVLAAVRLLGCDFAHFLRSGETTFLPV